MFSASPTRKPPITISIPGPQNQLVSRPRETRSYIRSGKKVSTISGCNRSTARHTSSSRTLPRSASHALPFLRMARKSRSNADIASLTRFYFATHHSSRKRDLHKYKKLLGFACRTGTGAWRGIGVRPREIAATRSHLEALVIRGLDANAMIFAVQNGIRRNVRDGVLVAQFIANILERLIEIVHMIREKRPAAGFLSQVRKYLIAFGKVRLAIGQLVGISLRQLDPLRAGADRINDHAVTLGHFN